MTHDTTPAPRDTLMHRLRVLGLVLGVIGLAFVAAGAYSLLKVQEGTASLKAFSAAENVTLTYNEDGQLVDRGEVAGAQAIMALLTDDWGYPVAMSELDPNDPVVNTASEYMFQMAAINYHTLHSTQTVVIAEDTEFNGEVIKAGTYEFPVDGRYWTGFDRENPIEAIAREQAWTGTPRTHRRARRGHRHCLRPDPWPRPGRLICRCRCHIPVDRGRSGVGRSPRDCEGPRPQDGCRSHLRPARRSTGSPPQQAGSLLPSGA